MQGSFPRKAAHLRLHSGFGRMHFPLAEAALCAESEECQEYEAKIGLVGRVGRMKIRIAIQIEAWPDDVAADAGVLQIAGEPL